MADDFDKLLDDVERELNASVRPAPSNPPVASPEVPQQVQPLPLTTVPEVQSTTVQSTIPDPIDELLNKTTQDILKEKQTIKTPVYFDKPAEQSTNIDLTDLIAPTAPASVPEVPARDLLSAFTGGVERGYKQSVKAAIPHLQGIYAEATGDLEGAKRYAEEAKLIEDSAPQATQEFKNISNASDIIYWGVEKFGEQVPVLATTIASGGLGGLTANLIAKGLLSSTAARALLTKTVGIATGYGVASGMETAGIGGELREATGSYHPGLSVFAGGVAGALELIVPFKVAKALFKGQELAKTIPGAIGKSALFESLTELGQESVAVAARTYADPKYEMFGPETGWRLAESFAAGGLVGGGVGGLGQAASRLAGEKPGSSRQLTEEELEESGWNDRPVSWLYDKYKSYTDEKYRNVKEIMRRNPSLDVADANVLLDAVGIDWAVTGAGVQQLNAIGKYIEARTKRYVYLERPDVVLNATDLNDALVGKPPGEDLVQGIREVNQGSLTPIAISALAADVPDKIDNHRVYFLPGTTQKEKDAIAEQYQELKDSNKSLREKEELYRKLLNDGLRVIPSYGASFLYVGNLEGRTITPLELKNVNKVPISKKSAYVLHPVENSDPFLEEPANAPLHQRNNFIDFEKLQPGFVGRGTFTFDELVFPKNYTEEDIRKLKEDPYYFENGKIKSHDRARDLIKKGIYAPIGDEVQSKDHVFSDKITKEDINNALTYDQSLVAGEVYTTAVIEKGSEITALDKNTKIVLVQTGLGEHKAVFEKFVNLLNYLNKKYNALGFIVSKLDNLYLGEYLHGKREIKINTVKLNTSIMWVILHELGHHITITKWKDLNTEQKLDIWNAYRRHVAYQAKNINKATGSFATGAVVGGRAKNFTPYLPQYTLSFIEYLAEQFVRYTVKHDNEILNNEQNTWHEFSKYIVNLYKEFDKQGGVLSEGYNQPDFEFAKWMEIIKGINKPSLRLRRLINNARINNTHPTAEQIVKVIDKTIEEMRELFPRGWQVISDPSMDGDIHATTNTTKKKVVIGISAHEYSISGTIAHEAVHAVRHLITDEEWNILSKAAAEVPGLKEEVLAAWGPYFRAEYAKFNVSENVRKIWFDRAIEEEMVAVLVGMRASGISFRDEVANILDKIIQFFVRLARNLGIELNWTTKESVLSAFFNGEIAARDREVKLVDKIVEMDSRNQDEFIPLDDAFQNTSKEIKLPNGLVVNGVELIEGPENFEDERFALTGYHGSPYLFDEFSTEKIGTGEGATAFGYGLYFAQNMDVARNYVRQFVTRGQRGNSTKFDTEKEAIDTIIKIITDELKIPTIAAAFNIPQNARMKVRVSVEDAQRKEIAVYAEWGIFRRKRKKVGEVLIDKQLNAVYVKNIYGTFISNSKYNPDEKNAYLYKVKLLVDEKELFDLDNFDHDKIAIEFNEYGQDHVPHAVLLRGLTHLVHTKYFADFLKFKGYKGIKYYNQFSRKGRKTKNPRNYVIFDNKHIYIQKRTEADRLKLNTIRQESVPTRIERVSDDLYVVVYDENLDFPGHGVKHYKFKKAPERPLPNTTNLKLLNNLLGSEIGSVFISENSKGWEVDFVRVGNQYRQAKKQGRKEGFATSFYRFIEKDLNTKMKPSGLLLNDGYTMWKRRDPNQVRYHVYDEQTESWYSPNYIRNTLKYLDELILRDPNSIHTETNKRTQKLMQKLLTKVDPKAWNDPDLDQMFMLRQKQFIYDTGMVGQVADRTKKEEILTGQSSNVFDFEQDIKQSMERSKRENARTLKLENEMGAPPEPALKYMRRLTRIKNLSPQQKALLKKGTSEADRISFFSKKWWGIHQLAWANPHITRLQTYLRTIEQWVAEREKWISRADQTMRVWDRNFSIEEKNNLAELLFYLTEMGYLAPNTPARRPTQTELTNAFAQFNITNPDLQQLFHRIDGDFLAFLDEIEAISIEAIKHEFANQRLPNGQPGQAELKALAELRAEMAALRAKPYFPMTRFGEWTLTVRDPNTKKVEAFYAFESQAERNDYIKVAAINWLGMDIHVGRIAEEAIEFIGIPGPLLKRIKMTLPGLTSAQRNWLDQLEHLTAPEGSFRKRMLHRKETPGYSLDAMRVYANYFQAGSGYLARLKYKNAAQDEINELRKEAVQLGDYTKRYMIGDFMQEHLNYMLEGGRDWAKVKALIAVWHLGFSPIAAATNLTQVPMVTLPYLGSLFGNAKAFQSLRLITTALKNSFDGVWTNAPWSGFEKGRQELIEQGKINAGQATELASFATSANLHRLLSGTATQRQIRLFPQKAMWMFQQAERVNRELTYAMTFKLIMENPNASYVQELFVNNSLEISQLQGKLGVTLDEAAAIVGAKQLIDRTQGIYAPWARPVFLRNPLASTIGAFFLFTQMRLFAFRNDPGAWKQLLVLMAIAGMMGLPGMDDLDKVVEAIARRWFGKDWSLSGAVREYIRDITEGTPFSKIGPDLFLHGISRFGFGAGFLPEGIGAPRFDASANMSLGSILPGVGDLAKAYGTYGSPTAATQDMAGAGFGVLFTMLQFMSNDPNTADWKKWEKVMPRALRGVSRSVRYAYNGEETYNNRARFEKFDVSDWDDLATIVAQALGATPAKLSAKWEAVIKHRDQMAFFRGEKKALYEQLLKSIETNNDNARAKVISEMIAFNEMLAKNDLGPLGFDLKRIRSSLKNRTRIKAMQEADLPQVKSEIPAFQKTKDLYPTVDWKKVK